MFSYRNCLKELSPYVPGKPIEEVKKELGLDQVVKLASNENPHGCSPLVSEAVIKTLEQATLYPDGSCASLREALAKKLDVKPGNLIFGAGVDEVISYLCRIFINPGDECVTAQVTFSQYAAGVLSMGGKMTYAPMKDNSFDLDAIAALISDETKMVVLVNPNNPTGTAFSAKEQEAFMKKVPPHVIVIVDEAYSDFAENDYPDTLSMMKDYPNIVLLRTFSKIYGLASFRIGYGVCHEEIISYLERVRCPFNVTVQAQAAALAALEDDAFISRCKDENRAVIAYCYDMLSKLNLSYIPTQANFIMIDSGKDSRVVFQELMKKGYIIRPGAAFGMDNYLRVTIGTRAQMEGFFEALREVLK